MARGHVPLLLLAVVAAVGAVARVSGAPATASAAPDPYAQLPSIDFGKSNPAMQVVADEVARAPRAGYAAVEAKLLEAVRKPGATPACRQFVADLLRIVGSEACVPVVISWLDDPATSDLAAFALQGLRGPAADDALLKAFRGATGPARVALTAALAARGERRILGDLARSARAPDDADGARASIAALGTLATPEAAAELKALELSDALQETRDQALIACAWRWLKDGNKAAAAGLCRDLCAHAPRANVVGAAMEGWVEADPEAAAPAVGALLKDKRREVALRAARAAGRLPRGGIDAELAKALPDLPAVVQVAVIRTLAERNAPAGSAAVRAALESPDEAVKAEAARACLTLGDAASVPPLLALAGTAGPVADAAMETLGRMKQPGIDDLLARQLAEPQAAPLKAVVGVLVARGVRATLPRLLELSGSREAAVRDAALKGVEAFAGVNDVPALLALLARAAPDDRDKFARVLWASCRAVNPKEDRFARLWKFVPDDDPVRRAAVLPLAASAGGDEPLKVVKSQLDAPDPGVKDAAARALFAWPDESAADDTLALLKSTDNRTYRVLAARSLAKWFTDRRTKLPAPRRQAMLREAMEKLEKPEDKKVIEFAREKIGSAK